MDKECCSYQMMRVIRSYVSGPQSGDWSPYPVKLARAKVEFGWCSYAPIRLLLFMAIVSLRISVSLLLFEGVWWRMTGFP